MKNIVYKNENSYYNFETVTSLPENVKTFYWRVTARNIGRKNLTMEHFASLMKKYNEAGIPTYSELILGLPAETKESFCKGICKLLENGQHNSVSVYHCEVLPNSELAQPEYIEKHKIEIYTNDFFANIQQNT